MLGLLLGYTVRPSPNSLLALCTVNDLPRASNWKAFCDNTNNTTTVKHYLHSQIMCRQHGYTGEVTSLTEELQSQVRAKTGNLKLSDLIRESDDSSTQCSFYGSLIRHWGTGVVLLSYYSLSQTVIFPTDKNLMIGYESFCSSGQRRIVFLSLGQVVAQRLS